MSDEVLASEASATPPNLRRRTALAAVWSGVGSLGTQVVTIAISVVLSRQLVPGDFGLMALATTAAGVMVLICEAGFVTSIVQRKEINQLLLSSVYWVQVALGALGALLLVLLARPTAAFYGDDRLVGVVVALSIMPLLSGFGAVPRALLVRRLDFKTLSLIDLLSLLVGGTFGIVAAAMGAELWSLVYYSIAQSIVQTWGRMRQAHWRPDRKLSRVELSDIFGFARSVYGSQLLTYVTRNGDNVLVGRFLGVRQLGLYTRSYTLLLFPSQKIAAVLGSAVQVALAKISDDKPRCRRVYLESCQLIFFVTTPVMLGLAILSKETVLTLFGSKWEAMWPTASVLAVVALFEPLTTTTGWVFLSQNRADLSLKLGLLSGPFLLAGVALGLLGGDSFSVAVGYGVGSLILGPVFVSRAIGLLDMNLREFARGLAPALGCGVLMGAAIFPLRLFLVQQGTPDALVLLACGALGAVVYLAAAHKADVAGLQHVTNHLPPRFRRSVAA
ncbi:MAG: colanic acid exporter [Frankiales bacterium]|nr:colanic acid exporter [Frankiales bacterium]